MLSLLLVTVSVPSCSELLFSGRIVQCGWSRGRVLTLFAATPPVVHERTCYFHTLFAFNEVAEAALRSAGCGNCSCGTSNVAVNIDPSMCDADGIATLKKYTAEFMQGTPLSSYLLDKVFYLCLSYKTQKLM